MTAPRDVLGAGDGDTFNMERKLASVQRALEILPIEGADAIELVRINGWQCVTKKGEFSVGDLGVFLEIDAIPPDTSAFNFLWTAKDGTTSERPDKFRIRTMKLRGALSQGLFLPLSQFDLGEVAAGDDVTERLGVTKYEPPVADCWRRHRRRFSGFRAQNRRNSRAKRARSHRRIVGVALRYHAQIRRHFGDLLR